MIVLLPEMILISPRRGHIHFQFSIINFQLFITQQSDNYKLRSKKLPRRGSF